VQGVAHSRRRPIKEIEQQMFHIVKKYNVLLPACGSRGTGQLRASTAAARIANTERRHTAGAGKDAMKEINK
jgi:hypothetical protein